MARGFIEKEERQWNPDITNHILQTGNSKMYGKEADTTNPRYNEHILPVPWHVIIEFHCTHLPDAYFNIF